MPGKQSRLNSWIQIDPKRAKSLILGVLDRAKGDKKKAATFLNVSYVTLWRSIRKLEMGTVVDALCKKWKVKNEEERAEIARKLH